MRRAGLEKSREISITLFREMFGDPGSNESEWECAALKDLATIVTGNTPPRKTTKYYGNFIEWIKSDNIAPPYIFLTTATERLSEIGAKMGRVVPQDSTLITCIAGSPNSIGNAAMANRPVALNQQINAVIPNERLRPLFLYWQLRMAKPLIQRMSTGNMKEMVTKAKLGELILMVPPSPLQEKFVTVSTLALQLQIRLEASLEALKQTLEQLSIDAFAGRLTRSRHQVQGIVSSSATLTDMLRRVGASLGNDLATQREKDTAIDHKPGISARHRKWLLDQLGEVQACAWEALLREWSGTLVPTEHMEDFMRSWPIEDREGQEDRVKRALSELAGLGLIARISIPNESGDYVTAYRRLREDELSRVDDLDAIKGASGDD